MGDDLDHGAKLSLKGINGHDPSSSLLCIYDRGGQPVAFFKWHTAGADQKPASSLSLSLARTRLSLQVFHRLETYILGFDGTCEGIA